MNNEQIRDIVLWLSEEGLKGLEEPVACRLL